MEEQKDMLDLLDMMVQPVFCVKENSIIRANAPAQQLLLRISGDVRPLLETGAEEYARFDGGCLYLTLNLWGKRIGASVRRVQDVDVFEVDTDLDSGALRAMALASGALRSPLNTALASTAALLDTSNDTESRQQLSQLNRSLYQMLRLLGNMSDAEHLPSRMETIDVPQLFREIFEKAQALVAHSGVTLSYQGLAESVYCLADRDQLERAVLNILSNAVKFSPKGSQVAASLIRRNRTLQLTIQDSGSGIAQEVMGSLFQRYLRQPGIEDSRFGLGLGIRTVHAAAVSHGGTLLIIRGEDVGTRIVMTMAIRQTSSGQLRGPVFPVDYSGGFDRCLVELADCLSPELYDGNY